MSTTPNPYSKHYSYCLINVFSFEDHGSRFQVRMETLSYFALRAADLQLDARFILKCLNWEEKCREKEKDARRIGIQSKECPSERNGVSGPSASNPKSREASLFLTQAMKKSHILAAVALLAVLSLANAAGSGFDYFMFTQTYVGTEKREKRGWFLEMHLQPFPLASVAN